MLSITGIPIELEVLTPSGTDMFNNQQYISEWVTVENVLVAPASETEITESTNLTGREAVYTLAIPKGDAHEWENRKVRFFGETWQVIGMPVQGIEAMIPLKWNKKIRVMRYE